MNKKLPLFALSILGTLVSQAMLCKHNAKSCLVEDRLLRVDQLASSSPIKTVSWLNEQSCHHYKEPFALIGGGPALGIDFKIYKLTPADTLTHIVDGHHGAYVLSSAWCCQQGVPFVAVAGAANASGHEVEIYRFDPSAATLTLVAYYSHGAHIYSIAWLCSCEHSVDSFLALGGEASNTDQADIRILKIPHHLPGPGEPAIQLESVSNKIHGATIYSVDWCAGRDTCPLLATGGRTSSIECDINIRVFSFDCQMYHLSPCSQQSFESHCVNSVKWCCNHYACSQSPLLAVGGSKSPTDRANIRLYLLSTHTHGLIEYAKAINNHLNAIYALGWNPSCKCTDITTGGGCLEQNCQGGHPNIFVYRKDNNLKKPTLTLVTKEQFSQNITSLAWYQQPGSLYSYLLVGAETNEQEIEEMFPDSDCENNIVIVLYKAIFCKRHAEPVPPICLRKTILS